MTSDSTLPKLRWGIIATGMIASWFVDDLSLPRSDALASHEIVAIGSSSETKARAFAEKHLPKTSSTVKCFGSYDEVYTCPDVDIVYIATPHSLHKRNCLDAIAAGKHVLVEKPMAMNAREAKAIVEAARAKGVFVMEGMWVRFFPLTKTLQKLLHKDRVIGNVQRAFCDFGLDMPLAQLPKTSRLKDPALGAGSLLDIGVYSTTWGLLALEEDDKKTAKGLQICSAQTLIDGIDVSSSMILFYPETGRHGILTSTLLHKTPRDFCRIEGEGGAVILSGLAASVPDTITVIRKNPHGNAMEDAKAAAINEANDAEVIKFSESCGGKGFYYEADAVAIDIAQGRTESRVMPLDESVRVLGILDEVRKQSGAKFPQDDE